ncbi:MULTISPECIES: glyoxalase [Croceitalea]|uniref:Glyoxalase n=1 Tax=Croceitalea vernalis TaxID=3075599 RepID=A0ABU3BH35_9FLAO|nr:MULTISPECIES: glyoxalase [unclassified Croceitalea]MDT0539664.1 glyoxalase [Croceitalea sp. P059]MDT0621478.1 glyoxalase [Croceitalea sp. P007]
MNDRSISLLKVRPEIKTTQINIEMSDDERFQNETLRPILKMQNPLFIAVFKNYIKKHKNSFYELGLEKRLQYIEHAVQRDVKFRNSLKGVVIGQFTVEEYELYITNSSALNKRMMNMVVKRLKDQLQLFERETLAY